MENIGFYIGTSGFSMSRTRYYQLFNVVELNTTFYKIPSVEWIKKLREEAPKDFVFTFKAFQGITHDVSSPTWKRSGIKDYKKLKGKVGFLRPTKEVFEFWEIQEEIAEILKSPIIVIQTPNSFRDTEDNIKNVNEFFSSIDLKNKKYKIAIEFRGWSTSNIKNICIEYDLIDITDPLIRLPVYDSRIKYYRLHGKVKNNKIIYHYKYTEDDLRKLLSLIKEVHKTASYVLFNNVYSKDNALEFLKLLENQ